MKQKMESRSPSWASRLKESVGCRLLLRTVRLYRESRCGLWASGLTYYSIFALVPVIALAFGVAKGFGLENWLNDLLKSEFANQQQVLDLLLPWVDNLLERARGGVVAGIGVVVLIYSVIAMIRHIENAVNSVLGVKSGRSLLRVVTDYLSMMLLCPLLLILAASATLMFNGAMQNLLEMSEITKIFGAPLMWFLKWVTPWMLASVFFMLLYIVLSNGKMRFSAALTGGVATGVLMRLLQGGYFYVQMHLTSYNAVYGSFAALPLFLLWMYLNWNILLCGVSRGSALQGMRTREFDEDDSSEPCLEPSFNRRMLLLVTALIATDYAEKGSAPGEESIALRCGLGLRKIRMCLEVLLQARVLLRTTDAAGEAGYVPALAPDQLTVCAVLDRLDSLTSMPEPENAEIAAIEEGMRKAFRARLDTRFNCRLVDLAGRYRQDA